MKLKTLCIFTLALSLMACSEDMLNPQHNQKTPMEMPDAKTLKKQPFMLLAGSWINDTNDLVFHIDSVGNFVMRDSRNAQITEQTGSLKDVSKSYALNDLRYELYDNKNQPMHWAFGLRQADEKTRELLLLDGSTATVFHFNKD